MGTSTASQQSMQVIPKLHSDKQFRFSNPNKISKNLKFITSAYGVQVTNGGNCIAQASKSLSNVSNIYKNNGKKEHDTIVSYRVQYQGPKEGVESTSLDK